MDQLTALRVFRAIVQENSFAGAGRRLGLSPAAISKNVSALEASLGVRLINRTTRRLSLTDSGALYSERVGRILEDLEEADRALAELSGEVSGRLRVSAPLTLGLIALSPRIPGFLQRYPRLTLDLDFDDRSVDIVREGFDLALRGAHVLEDSRLITRKVATLRYAVCASPAYLESRGVPDRPESLRDHDLVQFGLSSRPGAWTFESGAERITVNPVAPRYLVSSSLGVRDALLGGVGIGRIPEICVRQDLATGDLLEVLPNWTTGLLEMTAVYPSRLHAPPKINAFVEFMIDAFRHVGVAQDQLARGSMP